MRDYVIEYCENYGIALITGIFCLFAIISKWVVSSTYRHLVREAKDMGHSTHRFMKSICNRFEICYHLKLGVPDVDTFVDKYVYHYRTGGIRLGRWESISLFCMVMSMVSSIFGVWLAIYCHMSREVLYGTLFAGLFGNGVYLGVDCLFCIEYKKQLLRTDMIDYLGNVYKPRLENEAFHEEAIQEYRNEYFQVEKKEEKKKPLPITFTKEEEAVIREVLQEYML